MYTLSINKLIYILSPFLMYSDLGGLSESTISREAIHFNQNSANIREHSTNQRRLYEQNENDQLCFQ